MKAGLRRLEHIPSTFQDDDQVPLLARLASRRLDDRAVLFDRTVRLPAPRSRRKQAASVPALGVRASLGAPSKQYRVKKRLARTALHRRRSEGRDFQKRTSLTHDPPSVNTHF